MQKISSATTEKIVHMLMETKISDKNIKNYHMKMNWNWRWLQIQMHFSSATQ